MYILYVYIYCLLYILFIYSGEMLENRTNENINQDGIGIVYIIYIIDNIVE